MDVVGQGWCCPPRRGTAGPCSGSLPPRLVLGAVDCAGAWGGEAGPAAQPSPTPQGLRLTRVAGEGRWRHGACRLPKDIPAVSTVTAKHQLACHSQTTCHQEVTGLVTPGSWPCAGAGSSAASIVL